MKYFKKFAVMVLSAMMVLTSLALPTFATDGPVTINGVESGVVATFYKLAEVDSSGALKRIDAVPKSKISDLEKPTAAEIMALASNPTGAGLTAIKSVEASGTTISSGDLAPGIYLATFSVAEGANPDYIYNPVVVSVDKDGAGGANSIDAGSTYKWPELEQGATAQVKKATVPFEKVVERDLTRINGDDKGANAANSNTTNEGALKDADGDNTNDGNRGDTAAKGATVSFRINTAVPAYADNYFKTATGGPAGTSVTQDPGFEIYDTLNGLTLKTGTVKLYDKDGVELDNEDNKYYIVTETPAGAEAKTGFKVELTSAGVWNLRGNPIEVRYSATVNSNTDKVNFNGDTNTAQVKYSRAPGADPKDGEERTTYHYKFTINGKIDGNNSKENREVIKVGTDVNGEFLIKEEVTGITEEGWTPLDNVKFYLYATEADARSNDGSKAIREVESKDGGILRGMDELDAGKYWLVEAKQNEQTSDFKAKYAVNETPVPIEIQAKLQNDGRLESYMVIVGDTVVGNYKKVYTDGTNGDYGIDKGTETVKTGGTPKEVDGTAVGAGNELSMHKVKVNDAETSYEDYGVAVDIRNSKTGTLPSTGGMGTVLFTVGGIAIMALALLLLFGGKKKEQK